MLQNEVSPCWTWRGSVGCGLFWQQYDCLQLLQRATQTDKKLQSNSGPSATASERDNWGWIFVSTFFKGKRVKWGRFFWGVKQPWSYYSWVANYLQRCGWDRAFIRHWHEAFVRIPSLAESIAWFKLKCSVMFLTWSGHSTNGFWYKFNILLK